MLCTPPAFILSQDQTLECFVSNLTYRQLKSIRAFFLSFFYFLESCTLFKLTDLYFALFMLCTCLCCSIVKVQSLSAESRLQFFAELCYYITLNSLCQYFFQSFLKFFSVILSQLFHSDLFILPQPLAFVKGFFEIF